ncbi:hypothetical protein K438DRAFT_1821740 [Mycena galopus ATCC 62051]|nr:hypothetical protein K438DRAFT_1821740 [Mycena galopus ATCC 62051]
MASVFAHHLGTNYCPDDEEVLQIKNLLVEPTLRLQELDGEITKLQKALDRLAEERDSLSAYVASHQALLSPVRRLPLDTIQDIFIACLPTHRNCVMSASEAPLLLGRICSSWRTISLSTPRLWARLHVAEPPRGPPGPSTAVFDQKVAQRIQITKTWLDRSGKCPLSISLQTAEYGGPAEDTFAASVQFLQTLILFAPRWQHIHFTTTPSLILETMSYLDTDMPWLETVAFYDQMDHMLEGFDCGPFNMLHGARISSFALPGSIFIPGRLPLQWKRLTSLTIGGRPWTVLPDLTSEAILGVISGCPELRCCKLMVHDPDAAIPALRHPITKLPFLHTLAIHCVAHSPPAVSVLLMRLSMPELRNFTFLGSSQDSPSLGDFFADSNRLESLDIDTKIFSKIPLLETLRALPPTLQQLKICEIDDMWGPPPTCLDDDVLGVLSSPGICPALQDLYIRRGFGVSEDAVLRFITARISTLKRVDIHFHREMAVDIMPSLRGFIEMGLAVSLIYLPAPPSQFSPWLGLADAHSESDPPGWDHYR